MKVTFFGPRFSLALGMAVIIGLSACNNESKTETPAADSSSAKGGDTMTHSMPAEPATTPLVQHAEAVLAGTKADTSLTGTAKFDADSSGKVKLVVEITVEKLAGKSVAVHLHEHGDCGDNGNMAHGHWNPTKAQHGKWGSDSFHLGDIGNIKLDSKGKGTITITTDLWSLGGDPSKNVVGRAFIVHSGTDDYKTQPTGGAGSRIGCGVIN
jgi:Cu-Zn family superoxide dismutase